MKYKLEACDINDIFSLVLFPLQKGFFNESYSLMIEKLNEGYLSGEENTLRSLIEYKEDNLAYFFIELATYISHMDRMSEVQLLDSDTQEREKAYSILKNQYTLNIRSIEDDIINRKHITLDEFVSGVTVLKERLSRLDYWSNSFVLKFFDSQFDQIRKMATQ
jgi:hypothetical protein